MFKRVLNELRHSLIDFFAANAPAWLIEALGKFWASMIYWRAVRSSPAYRHAVKEHLGHVPLFLSAKDFPKLPILDKEGYLHEHAFDKLIAGRISTAYTIQCSSGFSGKPSYWLKTANEARKSNSSFRLVWDGTLNPGNDPALVIVGFSLGTWTSGTDVLRLSIDLAIHGHRKVTTVSPGENVAESLELIRNFSKYFSRLIIYGNPVYIKSLIDEGQDIDWKSLNVVFVTGGEPTTETWREYIAKHLGVEVDNDDMRIINVYGASDFGATTATETALSIRIKRLAIADEKLARAIFGRDGNIPNLYQYHPLVHHIEQHGDNFLVTYWSKMPLIRYNIHDRGRVFTYRELQKILAECGYDLNNLFAEKRRQPYKLPFLFVDTRDDGTVSIGGANVFPGNIETALIEHDELNSHVEHFYISVAEDENLDSRLIVQLVIPELQQKTQEWVDEFKEKAFQAIVSTLVRDNREYRVTWAHNRLVSPVIQLIEPEKDEESRIKRKYIKHELDLKEAL